MRSIYLWFICALAAKYPTFAAQSGHFQLNFWDVKSFYGPALYVNSDSDFYEHKVFQPTRKLIGRILEGTANLYLEVPDNLPNIELFFCEDHSCIHNYYSFNLVCIKEARKKCVTIEKGGKSAPVAYRKLVKPLKGNQLFISTEYMKNEFAFFVSYCEKLIMTRNLKAITPRYMFIKAEDDFKYKSGRRNIIYTNAHNRVSYYKLKPAEGEKYLKFDLSLCSSCMLRITVDYGRCKDVIEFKDSKPKYLPNYYPWKTVSLDITKANASNITLKFTTFTDSTSGFWAMSENYRLTEDDLEELHERYPPNLKYPCNTICNANEMWDGRQCINKRNKRKFEEAETEEENIENVSEQQLFVKDNDVSENKSSLQKSSTLFVILGVTYVSLRGIWHKF